MRQAWLLFLLAAGAWAQGRPAPTNVRGAEYPLILPDRRVVFRVNAPEARKVALLPRGANNGLGEGPYPMQRDDKGVWSVTTPPVRPGFHYYFLVIDGVMVCDPASETFFGWARAASGLEVPDPALDFYEQQDVPHGEIRGRWYRSRVTGENRRLYVYTPPGYDRDTTVRYPVLYLQHGSGESERAWSAQGRLNFILDNLLAAGKAKPMIVVMENGYAARPGAAGQGPMRGTELFPEVLVNDVVPLIDSRFRTLAARESRAIAGLSMGAGQATDIGFRHPERFAWVGAFSGGTREFDVKRVPKSLRLFWLGYGTDETGYASGKLAHEAMEAAGVRHTWFTTPGAHEWQVWRKHLGDFAARLFRD